MIHTGFTRVDAEGHVGLGVADDVLGDARGAFGGLEHVRDGFPQGVEDVTAIEAEFGLQPPEPFPDGLTPLAVLVLRVAGDQIAVVLGTVDKLVDQARNFWMDGDVAITRDRFVVHPHEADARIRINPDVLHPKLCDTFDTSAAEHRDPDRRRQRYIAPGHGGLVDFQHVLETETLPSFVLGFLPVRRFLDPSAHEGVSVVRHDLVRLEPAPIVVDLSKLAVDRLGAEAIFPVRIDQIIDPPLDGVVLYLFNDLSPRFVELPQG